MIVVRVELWPFGDQGSRKELGELRIANVGGTWELGEYDGVALDSRNPGRKRGKVLEHARTTLSVWVLVRKMLQSMKF